MKLLRFTACAPIWVGILLLFAGCATQPPAPVVTLLHSQSHLSVLNLPSTVGDDSLRRIFHDGDKTVSVDTLADDRRHVERLVEAAFKQSLARSHLPILSAATFARIGDMNAMTIGQPVDAADLTALQAQYPADAYLRVQVTDYGETPVSWESAYITFEVVTTVAIAGLLYTHTVTRPLAVAYVAEEGVEEFSEGYAGFWLINRLSRPVRIEIDLVDGRTGAVLWHDSETGMDDWHWRNLWHMNNGTRDILITNSTGNAVKALVNELGDR